jgi:hypothetical protein
VEAKAQTAGEISEFMGQMYAVLGDPAAVGR